jgi:hypothetical protein
MKLSDCATNVSDFSKYYIQASLQSLPNILLLHPIMNDSFVLMPRNTSFKKAIKLSTTENKLTISV